MHDLSRARGLQLQRSAILILRFYRTARRLSSDARVFDNEPTAVEVRQFGKYTLAPFLANTVSRKPAFVAQGPVGSNAQPGNATAATTTSCNAPAKLSTESVCHVALRHCTHYDATLNWVKLAAPFAKHALDRVNLPRRTSRACV
jgi:hypothetical protein